MLCARPSCRGRARALAPRGPETVPASPSESAILQLVPERLLTQLRRAIRARHYSPRTEQAYVRCCSFYRSVPDRDVKRWAHMVRGKEPQRLPAVLTPEEVRC